MKKITRFASLLLSVLMLASLLASCGDTATPDETKAPEVQTTAAAQEISTEPAETEPVFPDADYNGANFTVYARSTSAGTYYQQHIWAETENGDLMNDSTLKRNQMLQEKYNIIVVLDESQKSPGSTISKDIAAGDLLYDIVLDQRTTLSSIATQGLLYDVNQLNIDYSNPWWDSNCLDGYRVGGKNYFLVNDVSISNLSGTRFLYFNKQIVIDFNLTDPYALQAKNEWTLENFVAMVKSVSDIKTDGTLGRYGMLAETGSSNGNYMHLFVACGLTFADVNSDGEIECTLEDKIDKIQAITDILKTCFVDKETSLTYDSTQTFNAAGDSKWNFGRQMFAEGHFLFVQNGTSVSGRFNEMADDYGVMPNPKYDTNQERYYHKVDKYCLVWSVPNAASIDLDRLAKIMDYWSYASSTTVMPAYYDITIRSKRVSEATASANLDIVKNTITYELADLFCTDIMTAVNTGYTSGSIATAYKQYSKAIDAVLKATNQKLTAD